MASAHTYSYAAEPMQTNACRLRAKLTIALVTAA